MTPLLAYRVMADVVGVVLAVLVFVAIPLRYVFDRPTLSETISPVHGFLYLVLLVCVFVLGRERRWDVRRMVLVALGGTVPVVSFLVERRVTAREAATSR